MFQSCPVCRAKARSIFLLFFIFSSFKFEHVTSKGCFGGLTPRHSGLTAVGWEKALRQRVMGHCLAVWCQGLVLDMSVGGDLARVPTLSPIILPQVLIVPNVRYFLINCLICPVSFEFSIFLILGFLWVFELDKNKTDIFHSPYFESHTFMPLLVLPL